MGAASYDFDIRRGNSGTILFRFKDGSDAFDLTGSEMVLRVTHRGNEIIRLSTADGGLLMAAPTNGEVSLPYTTEHSRALGMGKVNAYEIERRIDGSERTLVAGWITGIGGVNDDE